MAKKCLILTLLILVTFHVAAIQSSKLNVARILLPIFNDFTVNFTLQSTDDSCFKWSVTREDVVKLTYIDYVPDLDCSPKAVVSAATKEKGRMMSDVVAEDTLTRQQLRCVVIVDTISSLEITTTTKELILEEAPEVFEVRAYDNQGNEFSSLTGVPFEWLITPCGPNKDRPVLRFIPFKESSYETPSTLLDLEQRNERGHKILLEGIKTGMSKVSIKLLQKEYLEVQSNEIQLTVVANLHILPPEVYVMVGDVVSFKIIHTSYGKGEEIDYKVSQYYLDVEDSQIAQINKETGTLNTLKHGTTNVVLHDKNIDIKEPGLKLPTALVNVVQPAFMTITLLPHKNWAAMLADKYDILIEIFTSENRKLLLGPGVKIETVLGDELQVINKTENGTYITVVAQNEGIAKIEAQLLGSESLTATSEITIYSRITLNPADVILPWDPIIKPKYDFDIEAAGGDGMFFWSSSNHSIGAVTQQGKVHTYYNGEFEIAAAMHRNHHNRQTAKVRIIPPTRLQIVGYVMESEVNSIVFLHIALSASKEDEPNVVIPFTNCQDLPFKVKSADPKFYQLKSLTVPPVGVACATVAITGQSVGSTIITISHTIEGITLEDCVPLIFFKPLTLLKPESAILLAVGSTTNLIFTGGPQSTLGKEPNRTIKNSRNELVKAIDTTYKHTLPGDEDYTIINVLCKKLGSSDIILSIVNSPKNRNYTNQEASVVTSVICGKPRHIELQPEIKVLDAKSCPMDFTADRIMVQSNKDIDILIRVKDADGRSFLNISSYNLIFNINPDDESKLTKSNVIEEKNFIGSAAYINKTFLTIIPKIESGQINVETSIIGYEKDILAAHKVTPEWPEFIDANDRTTELLPINTSISLFLVDDTIVTPSTIVVYNHASNRQLVDVKQGSGFYKITMDQESIALIKYIDKSRQLEIKPIADGVITVKLLDLCLVSRPALVNVKIVSVRSITVEMADKIELGKCILAIVRLYDESDNLLSVPNLDLVDVNSNVGNDIITIQKKTKPESDEGSAELHYIVNGLKLGDTKLSFYIGEQGYDNYVISSPMNVQVFPPLRIYPRNVTVVIGSQIQYTTKGGPQPSSTLDFTILKEDFAKISSNGILKGVATGQTKVKAKSLGNHPTTGQKLIYGEDTVDINVIKLNSIKIAAPLTRFCVGSTVPLWATGLPEQVSPLILATIEPAIAFTWSTQDADIAKIKGIALSTGIEYSSTEMLSVRLVGLTPGRTTVHLNATMSKGNRKTIIYASSIEIEIFEKLRLISPISTMSEFILLGPYSSLQLETNMDKICDLKYIVSGEEKLSTTDVQRTDGQLNRLITVSPTGLLRTYGLTGNTVVLITVIDTYGLKQTLTIPVEVKPVHYMMLSINADWIVNPKYLIRNIPVGTQFQLETTYYDNIGNKFLAATIELEIRTSRFDLLKIVGNADNSSFTVSTKRPGVTAVKIWSKTIEKTADYIKLNVIQTIKPTTEQVTVGDIICYFTPLMKKKDRGFWSVSDDTLVNIDKHTGIAVVSAGKGGQVSVTHSLHSAAPMHLNINPVNEILIEPCTCALSNKPDTNYHAYILLIGTCGNRTNNLVSGWDCSHQLNFIDIKAPFTCDIKFDNPQLTVCPAEVFNVAPKFDSKLGKYYCGITSTPDSNKKYNTIQTNVILTVRTGDIVEENKITFIPAAYIPSEVLLDDQTFSGTLTIIGLNSVLANIKVNAVEDSILGLKGPNLEETKLQYTIYLIDYHKNLEDLTNYMDIIVISEDTDQNVNVRVKVQNPDKFVKECSAFGNVSYLGTLHSNRLFISIVVAIIIVIGAIIYVYTSYMYPTVNVNVLTSSPHQTSCRNVANNSIYASTPRSCAVTYTSPISTLNQSTIMPDSTHICPTAECYCTRSPEIRRNRRYM